MSSLVFCRIISTQWANKVNNLLTWDKHARPTIKEKRACPPNRVALNARSGGGIAGSAGVKIDIPVSGIEVEGQEVG